MLEVGQEVVVMSIPGRFRIVEIKGGFLIIENDLGVRKKVRPEAVRALTRPSS